MRKLSTLWMLSLAAWLLSTSSTPEAAAGTPLPLDILNPDRLDYNNAGFEADPKVYTFPDLVAALADFRQRLGGGQAPMSPVRPLLTLGGFEFLTVTGTRITVAPKQPGTALLANDPGGARAWVLFEVSIDDGFGDPGLFEYFNSPAGPLLRLPVRLAGSGALNADFYFVWLDGAWREIDAHSWLRALVLPRGHGIWKGVAVNPVQFAARSDVWRDADGNCCPSGGAVEVELTLERRTLVVRRQHYRPAALSTRGGQAADT
jgi:hypothetical protein